MSADFKVTPAGALLEFEGLRLDEDRLDAGNAAGEARLPGAVASDDGNRFPSLNLERDVAKRPEMLQGR